MRNFVQLLVNFMIRAALGMGVIFFINQIPMVKEMSLEVGINAISFVATGCLGLPGAAMLYGMVASVVL